MKLNINNLSFGYNAKPVLKDINIEVLPKKVTALIGPNAAGKSTLLKCIARMLKPQGDILLEGEEIRSLKTEKITRLIGYLTQEYSTKAVLKVLEVVILGRLHSLNWRVGEKELAAAWGMLSELGINDLALKHFNELSGGQRQMVSIAQVLVREPRVLLLDEPTSSLDLQHQLEMFELIRRLTIEMNMTTIVTLHHLNMAARFADELIILDNGGVYAAGRPEEVLTTEMVRSVYGVNAKVIIGEEDGIPQVIPINSVRKK